MLFIVSGDYLFQVGSECYQLKTGEIIFLQRNIPHTFVQLSTTGKMIFLFQP
ncbi:cupin domain-containing protein [Flavobacterium polysaccharolyticum]|uniref:cupin domain-containing protein n=1 Tax=Flavobacterium polysaccharolyticum TaxID=3133148 RepID=UPI003CCB9E89